MKSDIVFSPFLSLSHSLSVSPSLHLLLEPSHHGKTKPSHMKGSLISVLAKISTKVDLASASRHVGKHTF